MRHNMVIIDMISIMMTIIWDYEAQGLHFLKCFRFLTPRTPTLIFALIVIPFLHFHKTNFHIWEKLCSFGWLWVLRKKSPSFFNITKENISILKSQHDGKSSNWNKQWLSSSLSHSLFFLRHFVYSRTFLCSCYCWDTYGTPIYTIHIRENWHIRGFFSWCVQIS